MMSSKVDSGKKMADGSSHVKLLNDVEAISKALYLGSNRSSSSTTSNLRPRSKPTGKVPSTYGEGKFKYNDNEVSSHKDKKSFWNWKPSKVFSGIKNRRFSCCFSLQVHSIEGLPPVFNDTSLMVHWKRRDGDLETCSAKVCNGTVEFEETLAHTCSIYGSRSGTHQSANYEAKHFLLYACVFEAPELDLGKHRVDLTRLLPLTLEELQEEKSCGKWSTNFKLSGKAKGATMNVSFGYTVIGDKPPSGNHQVLNKMENNLTKLKPATKFGLHDNKQAIRRAGSVPSEFNKQSHASSQSTDDTKDLHEVLPTSKSELATAVSMLYQKLDEEKFGSSLHDVLTEQSEPIKHDSCLISTFGNNDIENKCEDNEFSLFEQGINFSLDEQVKPEKDAVKTVSDSGEESAEIVTSLAFEEENKFPQVDDGCSEQVVLSWCSKDSETCSKGSLMNELESAIINMHNLEVEAVGSLGGQDFSMGVKTDQTANRLERSHSLDDVTESVASEFLNMLGVENSLFGSSSESEPESPRERLLRQFEKDSLSGGCSLFDFGIGDKDQAECGYNDPTAPEWEMLSEDFDLSSAIQAVEEDHVMATQDAKNTKRAIELEDMETEALMREWGLDERAFQCSPPKSSTGFGSPIDMPLEEPHELAPLGEGLGPFLQTKNGGFLRSMNPSLFRNAKSGGCLIMQASNPVVVPAEMGSGITEILQRLAAVGIEKLSMQANKLMPLEDITGKTMHQVAWEAAPTLEGPESQYILQHELGVGQELSSTQRRVKGRSAGARSSEFSSTSFGKEAGLEHVSIEDLAPLAMDKIEALSMEGLRIQSGMLDVDAHSNISTHSIGDISALQGNGVNITGSPGLEGTAGLQLLDIKDTGDEIDGLMSLSLTLDEWMKLDSGDIYDEDQISEQTSKILAAHHATSLDLIRGGSKGERRRGKSSGRKCGFLGNNFTVALMVQLRDPLRNYEPVGPPMLSLIQVERVFVPPKPRIYSTVSEVSNNKEDDDESESVVKEEQEEMKEEKNCEEEGIPQFRITEVHVAGLKTESAKKNLWGTKTQRQSGSRWLLANGMGKSNKHPVMKSKAVSKSAAAPTKTTVQPGNTLWSISSRVHGTGAKWK